MTPKATSSPSVCRICYDASDGFHFGALACRACAAFFRRSTVAKRHYVCRYNNKCRIEKTARCMCRACRLQKCLELGMKPEHVQEQRGRIRSIDYMEVKDSVEEDDKAAASVEEEPSQAAPVKHEPQDKPAVEVQSTEVEIGELPEPKPHRAVPVIRSLRQYNEAPPIQILEESAVPLSNDIPLLKKIYGDYCEYKKFRKIATEVIDYYGCANDAKLLRELTIDEAKRLIRADVSVVSVFINECIPGFKLLAESEKIALFKSFLRTFLIIDGSFWSSKYFPSPDDERCVVPFSGYIKFESLAELFICEDAKDSADKHSIISETLGKYRKLLKSSMVEWNISEVELLALLSIALWDNGIDSLCSTTKATAQLTRNILLKELYSYCSSIDTPNAPIRYGTLLEYLRVIELIMHETEKNGIVFKMLDMAIGETPQGVPENEKPE